MDPRLIAQFDLDAKLCQPALQVADHGVLGVPGGIRIEIEDIVVGDAVIDRTSRQHIPHGLHQAPGDDPWIRQPKPEAFIGNDEVDRIAQGS